MLELHCAQMLKFYPSCMSTNVLEQETKREVVEGD